jgi:MarR family transcriptional repressor of emrRAB
MADARTVNLLGAFVTGINDQLNRRLEEESGASDDVPAALVAIGYNEGRTVDYLSKTLGLSHSWTVRMVEKLETQGWVEKRAAEDKRAVALFLTRQGGKKVKGIVQARRRFLNEALAALPVKEHKQLTGMLERILGFVTTDFYSGEAICKLCEVDVCPQRRCPVAQRQGVASPAA